MGSFIPTTLEFIGDAYLPVTYTDINNTSRTGSCMSQDNLQRIATALGSEFSVVSMNFHNRRICTSARYADNTSNNNWVCGEDVTLPVLAWSKNPNLRMYIFGESGTSLDRGFGIYFYNILSESANPFYISNYINTSNQDFYELDVYTINSKVRALNIKSPSGAGSIIFHDDFIISTSYDNVGSQTSKDGWVFIDSNNSLYSVRSIESVDNDGYMYPTSGVVAFEKLFNTNYQNVPFTGLFCVVRGVRNTTQVLTQDGISYLLLGGRNSTGSVSARATLAISSEIIG